MNRTEIIEAAREATATLSVAVIDAKPITYDFSSNAVDHETDMMLWRSMEAVTCPDCGQYILEGDEHAFINPDGEAVPRGVLLDDADIYGDDELTEWAEARGFRPCEHDGQSYDDFREAEGPQMNYAYPLDHGGGRDFFHPDYARMIAGLPLCLVEIEGEDYLALTGGGMDMSWSICEAYIRLGFLPPTHFTLPEMAGTKLTERNARIVAAVQRANEVQRRWATNKVEAAGKLLVSLPLPGEEDV